MGNWQSTVDPNFVRMIGLDFTWADLYNGRVVIQGPWEPYAKHITATPTATTLELDKLYMSFGYLGSTSTTMYQIGSSTTQNTLEMIDLSSGRVDRFVRRESIQKPTLPNVTTPSSPALKPQI
jgi:hypothetical protein